MADLRELIAELNMLPQGYISKKKINGKYYYYYQINENGKTKSRYIKSCELAELTRQINRRREIEDAIRNIESSGRNIRKPSQRGLSLTGDLMMEDTVVASFDNGIPTFIDEKRCPLLIKRTGNVRAFLASRAIDRDRTHSRLLKKYLGIHEDDDAIVSIYSYGASITDNYWFKAKGSKLKYQDIRFDYDFYSELVLKGDAGFVPKSPKYTPQLTLIGSYEKCWKLADGTWYLYKQGSDDEIFSELFCSRLAKLLGVPTAEYSYDDGYIKTKNVADRYNLEPISSLAGEDDSFDNVFNTILAISEKIAIQYLQLILFDFIVYNVDRHNENCGIMRNRVSGKIISLAPNYDNNIALIAATSNLRFNARRDGIANYLNKFLRNNKDAARLVKEVTLNAISEEQLTSIFDSIEIKRDETLISEFIMARYCYVQEIISK